MHIPHLIRCLQYKTGWSQARLASELGVTYQTVNGWKNGRHEPHPYLLKELVNLAEGLGVIDPAGVDDSMMVDVIDIFCGCGGMSLGFRDAEVNGGGYRLAGALDIDPHCVATYERNLGITPVQEDITALDDDDRLLDKFLAETKWDPRNPLVLIGCAPCQGFSGHRKKDKRKDERNSLVVVFASVAAKIQPVAIVMENVPDIFARKHWHYYATMKQILEDAGYIVRSRIYNLAEFGVPQERFRATILAFKHPFEMPEGVLDPSDFRTVRDAIGHLPPLQAGEQDPNDPMHVTSRHRKETVELLSKIPKDGGSRPPGVGPACLDRVKGFYDVYGRLYWDRPAVTITARCRTPSCGRFVHPEQNRGLSVREAALLQGFPEDYMFEGPFDDKFKQIGNAVPPIYAKHLAEHVFLQLRRDPEMGFEDDMTADISGPITNSFAGVIAATKMRRGKKAHAKAAV